MVQVDLITTLQRTQGPHPGTTPRLLATSAKRRVEVAKGQILWRAQVGVTWGHDVYDPGPSGYTATRMKPLRNRAREGRANAKGIPVLYLATTKETAMAEVRPWKASFLSLAQFKLLHPVGIVDCTIHEKKDRLWYPDNLPAEKREQIAWADIDGAFSRPVTPSDDRGDYVATQVLAELFRDAGYDGILYRSALVKGFNIALFDLDAADVINCTPYYVRHLAYTFDEIGNPYFVKKYLEDDEEGQSPAAGGNT